MSDAQSASALERLYEDTTVRDELVDDDARILLEWGKGQVQALAKKELDDGAFEEQYAKLAYLMGRINRFVGKRQDADDPKRTEMLEKLVAAASEVGLPIPAEKLAIFGKEHTALGNAAALHTLMAMLTGDNPASQDVTVSSPEIASVPLAAAQTAQENDERVQNAAPAAANAAQSTEPSDAPAPPPTPPAANTFIDTLKQWLSSEGNE
jgi:hypothetical protein